MEKMVWWCPCLHTRSCQKSHHWKDMELICLYLNCSWADGLVTAILWFSADRLPIATSPVPRSAFTKLVIIAFLDSSSLLPARRWRWMPPVPGPKAVTLSSAAYAEYGGDVRPVEKQDHRSKSTKADRLHERVDQERCRGWIGLVADGAKKSWAEKHLSARNLKVEIEGICFLLMISFLFLFLISTSCLNERGLPVHAKWNFTLLVARFIACKTSYLHNNQNITVIKRTITHNHHHHHHYLYHHCFPWYIIIIT